MKNCALLPPKNTLFCIYIIAMRNEYKPFFIVNRLLYRAMHIVVICIMLVGAMPLSAQVYSTAKGGRYDASYPTEYGSEQQDAYSAQQTQTNYNAYQSTVYQPFESSAPSDNNPVYSNSQGDNNNRHNAPTNRRNLGGVEGDPGDQSDQSPVGEAWVMLLFAAVAALVVFVRQRRAAKLQA